jgi:phosphoserine phosphatase
MAPRSFYVDVDDTLVRSFGSKRVAIDATVEAVRSLSLAGAQLFCWSSGGAEYARTSATELGIEGCFVAFLPKPDGLIDDVRVTEWRLAQIHPSECRGKSAPELLALLPTWGAPA